MSDPSSIAQLVISLGIGEGLEAALNTLCRGAVEITKSRHGMIALLNEELGVLEVKIIHSDLEISESAQSHMNLVMGGEDGIVSYVAATGKPFLSGNVEEVSRYHRLFEGTRSELAVPVVDRAGVMRGVLNLESSLPDSYDEVQLHDAQAIATLIGRALEGDDHLRREEALIQIGSSLNRALTEEALIDQVTQVTSEVLRFQAASIFIHDEASDSFILRGSTSALRAQIDEIRYRRGEGCTGWVCATGQPILLQNPQTDPRWRGRYVEFPSEQISSFLCVPILLRGKPAGAIRVLRRKMDNPFLENRFTTDDLRLMEAIAEQVSSGLENVRNVERLIRSERMIAWGELSAKSSHMIGNRVFALKGDVNEFGHLLKSGTFTVEALQDLHQSLSVNVRRVEEILQDFRDFVSATQLNRTVTDLNEIVRTTLKEVFPKRSEIRLETSLTPEMAAVNVDILKIGRAVSELIENSLNYARPSADGPGLTVRTMKWDRRGRELARVEIEDNGEGVPADLKDKIFQPFFSGRVRGMGLGLSIVKGIVEAHGGEVFEDGEPGRGARFVILLPLADRQ